ncbi:MAG TPA: serine hydrolase domain-containing protein [Kineosporiaceae bacterium]
MRALTGVPGSPSWQAELEDAVDAHLPAGHQPGLAYGIVRDGELVHSGGRGRCRLGGPVPDASTVFRIASMTKSVTAAAVLLLRDEGRLGLDDEVARHVPEVAALQPPTDDAPPLTIRALLTMTAGLPTDDPWGDRQQDLPDDDFGRLIAAGGLGFAWTPGTAYEYSNTGYALLGRVITAATGGQPYADVVTRRLLAPLGMGSTVFRAQDVPADRLAQGYRPGPGGGWDEVPFAGHGSYAAMGGLFSTVADLATWVGGFTTAFPPRDDPDDRDHGTGHPLSRASRREQQQPHRGLPPLVTWRSIAEPPVVRGQAYGFGLIVEHDPALGTVVGHGGGYPGFGTHMRWHPASGTGVVVLCNATYAPASRLAARLLELALAPAPGQAPWSTWTPQPRPDDPDRAMASATAAARTDVNRLVDAWDDDLAGRLLASNVDADEPLDRRRAAIERIRAEVGPLRPDRPKDNPAQSSSPAHAVWWRTGAGGRVRIEIRLNPELPPRVQTLAVTAVPWPPAAVQDFAVRLAAALGDPEPAWPADWQAPPDDDRIAREVRVAAAWSGVCSAALAMSGDGLTQATFRLEGGRVPLSLSLAWVEGTQRLTSFAITPA